MGTRGSLSSLPLSHDVLVELGTSSGRKIDVLGLSGQTGKFQRGACH